MTWARTHRKFIVALVGVLANGLLITYAHTTWAPIAATALAALGVSIVPNITQKR
jgi:hypothetical protein